VNKRLFLTFCVMAPLVFFVWVEESVETTFLGLLAGVSLYAMGRLWKKAEGSARVWEDHCKRAEAGLQAFPYGVFVFDAEKKCAFSNRVAQHLFPGEEVASFADLLEHFSGHRKMREALTSFSKEVEVGRLHHLDVPMTLPSQELAWWRITVAPLPSSPGWTVWSFADLTPSARWTSSLEGHPVFLLELLHSSPIGYFALDEARSVVFCNKTFARWLGKSPSEVTGLSVQDLFAEGDAERLPSIDGSRHFLQSSPVFLSLEAGHGPCSAEVQQILIRDAFRSYCVRMEPQAPPALPSSEQVASLLQAVAKAPLGVLTLDQEGAITSCNEAFQKLMEHPPEEIIGRSLWAYVERESLLQDWLNGDLASPPLEVEWTGKERRAALLYGEHIGSVRVLYVIDITSRKRLENQALQSQKIQAIGQLAGGVAHDFNNLLTAMIGYCDLLLGRHSPAEQSFADVMQIKQNANRASHLVRQLLAFSRRQTLQAKVVDVTETISELSMLLQRLLGEKIDLQISYEGDLGLVHVDPIQLEQVIINLCVNARDAMPEGGTILLKTLTKHTALPVAAYGEAIPPGAYTVIEVQDTGTGIPPGDLPHIFDPFYSTKPLGVGTGLGLATVHGIVKQTGGFITVTSAVDRGTAFSVFLPIYEGPESAVEPLPAEHPRDLTGSGHILLVEDEEAVRLFSARALRDKGYTVTEADHGQAALDFLNAHPEVKIDLLLADVIMPHMDGPTLMKEARKKYPDLKGILISGYTEDRLPSGTEGSAKQAFLQKPFDIKKLAETVKTVLQEEER
jgi:two-component system cell cycle sensor histidine kinase/response regulator CckA